MRTSFPAGLPLQPANASAPSLSLHLRLSAYALHFGTLAVPNEAELHGRFRAQFVGPAWLRLTAGPSVALAGLRHWWGKELSGLGPAYNLVLRQGSLVTTLPMQLGLGTSLVDAKPCAVLRYGAESPFPWPHVIDELRALGADRLLGMSVIDVPVLRGLAFPFLLVREQ